MSDTDTDTAPKRRIVLRPILKCSEEQQSRVRELRNADNVRASMYTDHVISSSEHAAWLGALKSDSSSIVFVALRLQRPVGVVSVTKIDRRHQKADWAFYLDEAERGGLGASLEWFVIQFVFGQLGLRKLNCEVLETNQAVVKLHQRFGFELEGLRRSNIEKNGSRIGVYLLGLTLEDWQARKSQVQDRYAATLSRFDIALEDGHLN